jgi:hypothetical protein
MEKIKNVIIKPETLKLSVNLPAKVNVVNSGNYVVQKIREQNNIMLSANTSNAITSVAVEGAKKKIRLEEVSLEIGNVTWLPLKLSFKWIKK